MIMRTTKHAGATFVEALFASLILAMAVGAMMSMWNICANRYQEAGEISQAGQLARAELERAKAFGADGFPLGTLNAGLGVWAGSYDPTLKSGVGDWLANHFEYYDIAGNRLATSTTAGVRFSLQLTLIDSSIVASAGSTYALEVTSRRAVTATVRRLPGNTVIFTSGTNLVKGGL